jgi:pimeloyl-ACP methyl ester carboxylesterase
MTRRSLPALREAGHGRRNAALLAAAGAGAALATFNHLRARRAERRHPPTGRLFAIDGMRVHVHMAGEGPPLVLLNGNGSMVHDWLASGLFDRLRRSCRVIAIDRPGYGYTERPRDRLWTPYAQAELVRRTLAHLGVERPIVLGHSWGTIVALALALDHPETVRGLVLLSGYYFPTSRLDVWAFSPPAIPVLGDAMRYTVSPLLVRLLAPRIIRKIFEPMPVPPRFAMRFPLDLAFRPSQLKASAEDSAFMVPAAAALQKRYRELRLPVEILTGTADRIVTPERQSIRFAETIPGSELTLLPGLGHMIHYAAHEEIARAVEAIATAADERSEAETLSRAARPRAGLEARPI